MSFARRRIFTILSVLALALSLAPLAPPVAVAAGGVAFGDPIALGGARHGEPGIRVDRNDVAGGDASGDRLWVHAFESAWRSDNGGAAWTEEIGPTAVVSGDSDMAWAYPGGPNPDRIYKTELNIACEHFLWDDEGNGGTGLTGWSRNDANCGLPAHDRQWIQTGPAVLPDGSIQEGAENLYFIANQLPTGGFIAKSTHVAPGQPPHFSFVTHFQLLNNTNTIGFCARGFFDVDQEDGSIHIVDCTERGPLRVYSSDDGALTWSEEQIPAHSSNTNLFPVISVDDDGGLHVVSMQGNGDLLYSYRAEDGAWGAPVTVVAGDAAGNNTAVNTVALPWVDAGEGGRANIAYLATTGGPDPDNVRAPEQWHLWMSQTSDGGQNWTHAQADQHAVQTGCISTAGLALTGGQACSNRNLVDFLWIDHLSDGNAVISYTYGCPSPTGCDGVTGQSNGAQTRVVIQNAGSTIRGATTGGEPVLNITSPEDGATVPAEVVDVSGVVDRNGGGTEQFTATLSGPDKVANGAASGYSVVASNSKGDVTCTITAEGSPTRSNESADGCSVDLTWTSDGTFTVTGEATDGTSTATDTLGVTVSTPSGIPEPDGSIAGGITIFSDLNPVLAHSEVVSLFTGLAPKFLPGEPATFHTRFTEDATGVAGVGDAFTWHIWNADGELVDTADCIAAQDSSLGEPNGFDCEATIVMPSDIGRYYTTLQFDGDGRWSCHDTEPLVNPGVESPVPNCIKAFDVVADTSTNANVVPRQRLDDAMPYFVPAGTSGSELDWSIGESGMLRSKKGSARSYVQVNAAEPREAPSGVPDDPEITDGTGDVTGAGLPIDHMDVEAAWFENDASFLYIGLKLGDIPADPATTAQVAYHVNFLPDWVTDPQTAYGVPATNSFTGLRVQGILSPLGFNSLTSPVVKNTHHAELQHLSTNANGLSQFGKVTDLELVSIDPDTDIIWWAVPRDALAAPGPGDTLSALSANSVPAVRGLVTFGSFYGDSATADGRTYGFADTEAPLGADAGGPYSGAPNESISITGTATGGTPPYACAWTGPVSASFADANACETAVTFGEPGDFTIDLTVTDDAGAQASASAPITVASSSGERVDVFIDGTSLAGSAPVTTDATDPSAPWSVPADLSGLSGEHTLTARWFDADDTLLDESTITVTVEPVGPEFEINITSPADGDEIKSDFVVEGTTTGTASEAGAQGGRSSTKWKRAVKVIPADRLKVAGHGPPVPADSVGIGPGSTLISYFDGFVGICTAAFIWKDPNTGKVYIGAAGHCFMDSDFEATHGPDADYDPARTTRIRVCVSTCLGGASGLFSAAFGIYPSATRDLGKLAYARQTLAGVDVGNDFGIVEIPPALHDEIRTDLPVWNGPNTAEFQPLPPGNFVAQYGNGIVLGEVFPTKARMGIGAGSNDSRWIAAMASSQGDSGSAVVTATATVGTNPSVEGQRPVGMLTHLSCCLAAGNPYTTAGTTVPRAIEMARQDAGINLELIHDVSQLAVSPPQAPTGLSATAGNGAVELSWAAPSDGGAPISGYTVKWGTEAGGPYPDSRTVTDTQATIDGLTNGVTYHFVVSATNSAGESPNSAEVSAAPTSTSTVPGAPTDLAALAGDGEVALSWQAPTDDGGEPLTGYTVKWGPTAGGAYPNSMTVSDPAATVTGLTNDVTYFFVVAANNANGEGPNSKEVEATPRASQSPFTVEARVLGSTPALEEWTEVDVYDGSAWSKAFNDVPAGDVILEARLLEDGAEAARDSIAVTVASAATRLSFAEAGSDVAGSYSDNATLKALLVTDEESSPIGRASVSFELTGEDGTSKTWTAVTGDDGIASRTIALDMPPGSYNVVARFAGDDEYEQSGDQTFFTVEREVTETALVVTGKGKNRKLTATLVEDDGPPLKGIEIVFYGEGRDIPRTEIGRATTDKNGVAVLPAPDGWRGCPCTFEAVFVGTALYRESSGSDRP